MRAIRFIILLAGLLAAAVLIAWWVRERDGHTATDPHWPDPITGWIELK